MTEQPIRQQPHETLSQEIRRLVSEYRTGGSCAEEAWNLIADCVEENVDAICTALDAFGEDGKDTGERK